MKFQSSVPEAVFIQTLEPSEMVEHIKVKNIQKCPSKNANLISSPKNEAKTKTNQEFALWTGWSVYLDQTRKSESADLEV